MTQTKSSMRWAATGIGVSDMDKSVAFYTELLGMKVTGEYKLPHMREIVLSFGDGPSLALMHFTEERNTKNNPVKLVFSCDDAAAAFEKIRKAGYKITRELKPFPALKALIGFAQDPDGYDVELVEFQKADS